MNSVECWHDMFALDAPSSPQVPEAAPYPSPPSIPPHPLSPTGNKINRIYIEHDDKIYWKLVSCKSSTRTAVVSFNAYCNGNHLYTHRLGTI